MHSNLALSNLNLFCRPRATFGNYDYQGLGIIFPKKVLDEIQILTKRVRMFLIPLPIAHIFESENFRFPFSANIA